MQPPVNVNWRQLPLSQSTVATADRPLFSSIGVRNAWSLTFTRSHNIAGTIIKPSLVESNWIEFHLIRCRNKGSIGLVWNPCVPLSQCKGRVEASEAEDMPLQQLSESKSIRLNWTVQPQSSRRGAQQRPPLFTPPEKRWRGNNKWHGL